jgi:hypothetical protein
MRVRDFRVSDIPALQAMAEASGFPYPDLKSIEAVQVVVNEEDVPIMAVAAERTAQLYLFCGKFERPHAKVHAIRLLDESMAKRLRALGYNEVDAFLPPEIAKKFSRRLEQTFGWCKNWPSWAKRF